MFADVSAAIVGTNGITRKTRAKIIGRSVFSDMFLIKLLVICIYKR